MKKLIISASIAIAITSCASTTQQTSAHNSAQPAAVVPLAITSPNTQVNNPEQPITLEKIMSDPDWMGNAPQQWYWGADSQHIYYHQKQQGSPLRDLFQVSLAAIDSAEQVNNAHLHVAADQNGQTNASGTHRVYVFKGNVFVKEIASGVVSQLTYTSDAETDVMFLNNGDVAYRVGHKFYRHQLNGNRIIELASLKFIADPNAKQDNESYIAKEQQTLIDYIALTKRNRQLKNDQAERLKAQNSTITQTEFYLGDKKRLVHSSLSPNGDKLLISITDDKPSRADSDIMPNYISEDAMVKAEKVRARVADERQYQEQLLLLDLTSGQQFPLSYDQLQGFDQDVLASVKKENAEREGKSYQSTSSSRNIHVMRMNQPIKWQADGKNVAVMLEAWDNKDRWLASVNLLENKLVQQHRLHDDAWINYTFNEYDWLGTNGQLYYLSEESGYSQLYIKTIKGKAKALTSGKFVVSNVSKTLDGSTLYFKANIKHPGIYEIYSVNVTDGKITQHTNFEGVTDYALSPDESKLLLASSTVTMPAELFVKELGSNGQSKQITNTVSEEFKAMPWVAPTVVAIPSSHQQEPIYARVYLPKDFDKKSEKLRAVMFSHGAGYLQNAHLGWSGYFREFMFHSMLVQQGYAVIDMDYRASKGYGRDWRTAIYRHMGKPEVQDMLDGVEWLVENANVDRNRIGTYGGSYGGFLTLMALFTEPETFQSGAALRLVSDWAYYNHGYTSNILNTPGVDPIAYERSSPIYFAEGLNKPLLINAPMVDDNVFFQDTVRLVQRLIELEKQDFETAIYPVEPHGFVQPSSWLNEYRRIYKLFEQTL
ncbi:prolyl oligopeptidase family serine peptidase [Colwellia sp. MEBiC06753]